MPGNASNGDTDQPTLQCCFCARPRAEMICPVCSKPVCRKCADRNDPDTWAMVPEVDPSLKHPFYCPSCFAEIMEPAVAALEADLKLARELPYFTTTYRGRIPLLKKAREAVEVSECRDRADVLLALALRAVRLGFNALIEVKLESRKVRNHGYQKMLWNGSGIPAEIDLEKLERNSRLYDEE